MRVLRGFGVESESELAFAALHQIVRPVLDHLERLPSPQASALKGAFGLATAHDTDRFLIAVGALSLLAEVAEERPLLCLVDDAQWLDQASWDALAFAARRLEAEGIVLLLAARDDEVHPFAAPGVAITWSMRPGATRSLCWSCRHRCMPTSSPDAPRCPTRCR